MGGFFNALTSGASTITSANAVVTLTVPGLFDVPVRLFGFGPDNAWETASVVTTETQIGVDVRKTAGLVFNPVKHTYSFQADSPSVQVFEAIYAAQYAIRDLYYLTMTFNIPATGQAYIGNKGTLEDYNAIPSAGKVLKVREFSVSYLNILAV